MKYRLIRFSNKEHKVELDMQVSRPDFMGCNREWINKNPEGSAVLIEYSSSKDRNGVVKVTQHYYIINQNIIVMEGSVASAGHPTWVNVDKKVAFQSYKYLQMLELTNSL